MGISKFIGKNAGTLTYVVAVFAGIFFISAIAAYAVKDMPSSGEQQHMKQIGYNDLQARQSLQVTAKGDWLYVGHHPGENYNPLTDAIEWNGTTILDISDPSRPEIVVHIPNPIRTNSRATQVAYDYMGSGEDYLIRNAENDLGDKFEIWNITDRANPFYIGAITDTPADSCGPGCGGPLRAAHKGWWDVENGIYYGCIDEPGFYNRFQHLGIWGVSDLLNPVFLGRGWLPGQKLGEPEPPGRLSMHHPIVDVANDRVYAAFLSGGDVAAWDVSDKTNPVLVWHVDTEPPGSGTHTVAPVFYETVPNFEEGALPRVYALVADEATGGDMAPPRHPERPKIYMMDITSAEEQGYPMNVETWQVPNGDYLLKGGRFGPHQFNETVDGELADFADGIVYIPYFNAGVRAIDISDPYNIVETGYYVPQFNERMRPVSTGQIPTVQVNDLDVDYRGLIYASGRTGGGLWVLEYTGKRGALGQP